MTTQIDTTPVAREITKLISKGTTQSSPPWRTCSLT